MVAGEQRLVGPRGGGANKEAKGWGGGLLLSDVQCLSECVETYLKTILEFLVLPHSVQVKP